MTRLDGVFRVTVGTEWENREFIECLDEFRARRALIFDLDDTLVDTTYSYDKVVADLVLLRSGSSIRPGELEAIRLEGGFNDDWDTARELIRRRGVDVPRQEIERQGKELYLALGRESESLLFDRHLMVRLGRRFRLFVYTGRPRDEYEPVWGSELGELFEDVVCLDDYPDLPAKPSAEPLKALMGAHGVSEGYYVGNSIDDISAGNDAGLFTIGVATTLDRETLKNAGARLVVDRVSGIEREFQV
jgi:phosphoglycolate phosphatase-like HAD superfamily hydrolase